MQKTVKIDFIFFQLLNKHYFIPCTLKLTCAKTEIICPKPLLCTFVQPKYYFVNCCSSKSYCISHKTKRNSKKDQQQLNISFCLLLHRLYLFINVWGTGVINSTVLCSFDCYKVKIPSVSLFLVVIGTKNIRYTVYYSRISGL